MKDLENADNARNEMGNKLELAQKEWSIKLKLFEDEATALKRIAENEEQIEKIENVIDEIDRKNDEIIGLMAEKQNIEKKIQTDAHRDDLKEEHDKILQKVKRRLLKATEEKKNLDKELGNAGKKLDERNKEYKA